MFNRFNFLAIALILLGYGCGDSKQADKQPGSSSSAKPEKAMVTIGTGSETGLYFLTGQNIVRMLEKKKGDYNIIATVESTGGSVYNINALMSGDLDFGIAQSDLQYQAYHGQGKWEKQGKQSKLRSVFSLHPESITLVASAKSNIKSIKDLKGKRVNLGNPGSGQLQNSQDLLEAYSLKEGDLKAERVKAGDAPQLLQDERLDAFFYTVGHPNANIKEATQGSTPIYIVSIEGDEVDKMIKGKPYYAKSKILKEFYQKATNKEDIHTVGVKATFVTSSDVKDDVVYAFTKEVFENLDAFKELHPAYKVLTKEAMLEGLSAPIHPGAMKYFKEVGLDKKIRPELKAVK